PHLFTAQTQSQAWSILSCGTTRTITVRCLKGLSSRFVTETRPTTTPMFDRHGFAAGSQVWMARSLSLPRRNITIAQAFTRVTVISRALATQAIITKSISIRTVVLPAWVSAGLIPIATFLLASCGFLLRPTHFHRPSLSEDLFSVI